MSDVSTWSTTASSNNSSPPDGWPEGMAASSINNVGREMMAAVATWHGRSNVDGISAMRGLTPIDGETYYLRYHTSEGDLGAGLFRGVTGASAGTYVDNGGTILVPTGGDGSAAFLRDYSGQINPLWFGATGDGSTDDYTALQAAWDADPNLYVPGGTYLLSDTLTNDDLGASLVGDGPENTVLSGTASTGAVVRMKGCYAKAERFSIKAAGDRESATNTSGYGLHIEPDDVAYIATTKQGYLQNTHVSDVVIQNQPSTGLYVAGGILNGSTFDRLGIFGCRGHGAHFEAGAQHRTNYKTGIGLFDANNWNVFGCSGNGLALGNPADTGTLNNQTIRAKLNNLDVGDCALEAGVRFDAYQIWSAGSHNEIERCYCSDSQQAALTVTGSITVVTGETITQASSGAEAQVITGVTGTSFDLKNVSGTFDTSGQLVGSTSGALGASSVPVTVEGPTTGGVYVQGTKNQINNLRTNDCNPSVRVGDNGTGLPTKGISIRMLNPLTTDLADADPVVTVHPDASQIHIDVVSETQIETLCKGYITGLSVGADQVHFKKQIDQTVNNTTTKEGITYLAYSCDVEEEFYFDLFIHYVAGGTGGNLSLGFDFPAGSQVRWSTADGRRTLTSGTVSDHYVVNSSASTIPVIADTNNRSLHIKGYVKTFTTPGIFQPTFAQVTAAAHDLTIESPLTSLKIEKIRNLDI